MGYLVQFTGFDEDVSICQRSLDFKMEYLSGENSPFSCKLQRTSVSTACTESAYIQAIVFMTFEVAFQRNEQNILLICFIFITNAKPSLCRLPQVVGAVRREACQSHRKVAIIFPY